VLDLDAYFARIAWHGPREASQAALAGILAHHMRAIPFENFDVLLGRPPSLALDVLEAKLVGARRGGYCFEHATLLAAVLCAVGFRVTTHSARVIMRTPREQAARNHMFLVVDRFVLDPGFGAQAPLVPVPLDGSLAAGHRCICDPARAEVMLVQVVDGVEQPLWLGSLREDLPIDFEVANHFTATHASSPFVQHILAHARTADGEIKLADREVTYLQRGVTRGERLVDRAALRQLCTRWFGFDLPALESVRVPAIPGWS
jgi:N-hydroxyarylamine O-acetyltransferase